MDFSFLAEASDESDIYEILYAAYTGDLNLFKRLAHDLGEEGVEKIASCKDDGSGATALHLAAFGGRTHILKYLVGELKLDVNVKANEGETPLHFAIKGKHFHISAYLIDNGANLNAANDEGVTALHAAVLEGSKKLVELLISKGAEVDASLDAGTPLQCAATEGKKDCVKLLLENHANPNVYSDRVFRPLTLATINGSVACVKLLLKAGADPNITNCAGEVKPLDIAVLKGDTEIVNCLVSAGADPDVLNDHGLAPIEFAAVAGNYDVVMALYPITSPISDYPDWSVDGLMAYIHSDELKEKRKRKMQPLFKEWKLKGTEAAKRMEYHDAIKWFTKAITWYDMDATLFSNRSLCWARLEDGNKALEDAEKCVELSPFWPKAYYRVGAACMLLRQFARAADAFFNGLKLDRKNKELERAFREAVEARRNHG